MPVRDFLLTVWSCADTMATSSECVGDKVTISPDNYETQCRPGSHIEEPGLHCICAGLFFDFKVCHSMLSSDYSMINDAQSTMIAEQATSTLL